MKLHEMKIVVTGAASGMGRDFTLKLAEAGAGVVACDLNEDGLRLAEEAADVCTVRIYVTNAAVSVRRVFFDTAGDFGGLNGLINNAGIFRRYVGEKGPKTGAIRRMSSPNGSRSSTSI